MFINGSLLAGVALIGLPILLHLIMRQRPKRLEFPALRFVEKRHEVNQRRLRLRHLLLLLLRAGLIALLALALARPRINLGETLGRQQAPVAAALVFDPAPRMAYRHQNRTRLEEARELGRWLLAQLPPESQIAVLDGRPASAAFQVDRGAARDRIDKLQLTSRGEALPRLVIEAAELLARSALGQRELYVFTDLAQAAWPQAAVAELHKRLGRLPKLSIYVIDVGVESPQNFALGRLQLSDQVLSLQGRLRLQCALKRMGPAAERTVELYLIDPSGQQQRRNATVLQLETDQAQQIEFSLASLSQGTHQGMIRIAGGDGLAEDDVRFFTFEVRPPWKLLVAAPEPAERKALYLTEALSPTGLRRRGEVRFACRVIPLGELAHTALDPYDAVCLLDPAPLEPAVWQKLADFAAERRGVAIFLGRNALPVDSFNQPPAADLLAGRLLRQARRPDGECYFAPQTTEHPVLAAFGQSAAAAPWRAMPVFRYWELQPATSGVAVVIRLSDGRPAVLERPLGEGRVLTITTPVSDDPNQDPWNLLPVGAGTEAWPFVVLVNQMADYLVGAGRERFNYEAGQPAVLALDSATQRQNYLLLAPDGLSFPLSADLKRQVLTVSSTQQPGNYRVRAGGAAGVDRGFSVNLDPEQTRLDRLTKEQKAEIFAALGCRVARTRAEIDRDVSMGRVGRELFPALILLLGVVLGAEMLVANRFYRA